MKGSGRAKKAQLNNLLRHWRNRNYRIARAQLIYPLFFSHQGNSGLVWDGKLQSRLTLWLHVLCSTSRSLCKLSYTVCTFSSLYPEKKLLMIFHAPWMETRGVICCCEDKARVRRGALERDASPGGACLPDRNEKGGREGGMKRSEMPGGPWKHHAYGCYSRSRWGAQAATPWR